MKFNINETVICVNARPIPPYKRAPPVIEGNQYKIRNSKICQCGHATVDVGISSPHGLHKCGFCNTGYESKGIWWCAASRFSLPIDDITIESVTEILTECIHESR